MKILKRILYFFGVLFLLFVIAAVAFKFIVTIDEPLPKDTKATKLDRIKLDGSLHKCGKSMLRKSSSGLWELYTEGGAFERGVETGKLTAELIDYQERAFVAQIKKMIPSQTFLHFLRYFIAWFNRDIDEHVTNEYQLEIFGISMSASKEFEFIGDNYQRILNYHAAHDIGHALQDMNIVGCTSFSVWGDKSSDKTLLAGRNFDFYVGDDFAKNKIVCFVNPEFGLKFMMITWGGMIGAVSGMNEQGLTVTINAAKSDLPTSAATPISLVAREILQYAKNIDEAVKIAKKRVTFVSEAIMIASANDGFAAVIEKTPYKTGLFETKDTQIECSNHYQCDKFAEDKSNLENIRNSSSEYRAKRMKQLLGGFDTVDFTAAAAILRDTKGLNGADIGLGNEKSINQLISHHSVIFKPAAKLVWVSTKPFQIGKYVCYDLNNVFETFPKMTQDREITLDSLEIPPDSLLFSKRYKDFKMFKKTKELIKEIIDSENPKKLKETAISEFVDTNPQFFQVYSLAGDYLFKFKLYKNALEYYKIALQKEIPTIAEKKQIKSKITECRKRLLMK